MKNYITWNRYKLKISGPPSFFRGFMFHRWGKNPYSEASGSNSYFFTYQKHRQLWPGVMHTNKDTIHTHTQTPPSTRSPANAHTSVHTHPILTGFLRRFLSFPDLFLFFLPFSVALTRLYTPLCLSVRQLVGLLVPILLNFSQLDNSFLVNSSHSCSM